MQGLADDDHVLLSPPADHEKLTLVPLSGNATPIARPGADKAVPPTKVDVKPPAPASPPAPPATTPAKKP
jgi:hypothetical protein